MRLALAARLLLAALPCSAASPAQPGAEDAAVESSPAPAPRATVPARASGGTIKLIAYDEKGRLLDLEGFLARIGRADKRPSAEAPPILAASPDGLALQRVRLEQSGPLLTLSWERLPRVHLSLPWPLEDYGFSTVWVDKGGPGFSDGDVVYLNEEIAQTQYRHFRDSWLRHGKDMSPPYEAGGKAAKLQEKARQLIAEAQQSREGADRARAYDRAFHETALAWEKMLFEHGLQQAYNPRTKSTLRFGLTLDEGLLRRLDHYEWIVEMIERSRANWVRLVFRSNPADFTYSRLSSFNEYDTIVKALRAKGIRVMGCVLDTAQWPSTLTPPVYAERTKNLVLHYRDLINSWEVGSEINGDWLGGAKEPLSTDQVFRIFQAGAAQVKEIEPSLETVATLYWWDSTAPDPEHALFGWLSKHAPRGFARDLDVVAVSLWPEDAPVGTAFERVFERLRKTFPDKRLLLGSFGYVEGSALKGYWWLHPSDVDGGRKDLAILYSTASCGVERSSCGGFFWQTLDQMIPSEGKNTDLFRVYKRSLEQLGR